MTTIKNILLINAVSSGATGIGLIVFANFAAQLFEVSNAGIFLEVGLFLVLFAGIVAYQSLRRPISSKGVTSIIVLDVIWVLVSFVIVSFQLFQLSFVGYLLTAGVALWVAAMAILQTIGLKQLTA